MEKISLTPETINRWRIIPRMMLGLYGYMFWRVAEWFMALDAPNAAQSAFVSVMVGAAATFFGLYVNSGPSLMEMKESKDV